jgi:hypothetical protein
MAGELQKRPVTCFSRFCANQAQRPPGAWYTHNQRVWTCFARLCRQLWHGMEIVITSCCRSGRSNALTRISRPVILSTAPLTVVLAIQCGKSYKRKKSGYRSNNALLIQRPPDQQRNTGGTEMSFEPHVGDWYQAINGDKFEIVALKMRQRWKSSTMTAPLRKSILTHGMKWKSSASSLPRTGPVPMTWNATTTELT